MLNLLLWFDYDIDGNIVSLVRIEQFDPGFDLDKFFEDYMAGVFAGGGIDGIRREHVHIPDRLMGIEGIAFVLYHEGKRFRAALPYNQLIKEK